MPSRSLASTKTDHSAMSVSSQTKPDAHAVETTMIVRDLRVRQTYKRTLTGSTSSISFWDPDTGRNYQPSPIISATVRSDLRLLHDDCLVRVRVQLGRTGGSDTIAQITDAKPFARKTLAVFFETVLPHRDVKWQSKGGHGQAYIQTIKDASTKKIIMRKMSTPQVEKSFWAQGNVPLRVISKRSLLGIVTILRVVGAEADLPPRMAT